MKIFVSPYELSPLRRSSNERSGVLVKVEFTDGITGYSDLHPWPELGDPSLKEILEALRTSPLTQVGIAGQVLPHQFGALLAQPQVAAVGANAVLNGVPVTIEALAAADVGN